MYTANGICEYKLYCEIIVISLCVLYFQSGSKEVVAIKVVEKTKLSSRGKNDIITEIQVMKLMKHKYIVDMKDFEWDEK